MYPRVPNRMNFTDALTYQLLLNKCIDTCLRLNISYPEIYEFILLDEIEGVKFIEFLSTKVGKIWLNKPHGQSYTMWQGK